MSGIFISYRREDTSAYARLLSESLAARFGADKIFRDIDSLQPGVDFPQAIAQAVGSCDVLVALIGRRWLTAKREGRRRLDDPEDYVRLEVAAALERDTLVIPVLIEDASMPRRQDLPETLRELADRNAQRLTDEGWNSGIERLTAALEKVVTPPARHSPPVTTTPAPPPWTPPAASPSQPSDTGGPSYGSSWEATLPPAASSSPPSSRPGSKRRGTGTLVGAALALIVVVVVIVLAARGGGGGGGTGTSLPFDPNAFLAETNVSISPSTGAPGTIVTVTGEGFLPNERIDIHFDADLVTQTRADGAGKFSGVTFAVPSDAFRNKQSDVSATGGRSFKTGMAAFRVT